MKRYYILINSKNKHVKLEVTINNYNITGDNPKSRYFGLVLDQVLNVL